jgi:hypothetical protein
MAQRDSICTPPALAALHRAVRARVFRRPSVSSPARKKSAHSQRLIFLAPVPHRQRSTSDFLRIVNDFHPLPLRIYPGRLRPGCGRDAARIPLSAPVTERARPKEAKK